MAAASHYVDRDGNVYVLLTEVGAMVERLARLPKKPRFPYKGPMDLDKLTPMAARRAVISDELSYVDP